MNSAVVPGYYLVCYNCQQDGILRVGAVVPGYYLVCYNYSIGTFLVPIAVVPGYYLVCYNIGIGVQNTTFCCSSRLLLGML